MLSNIVNLENASLVLKLQDVRNVIIAYFQDITYNGMEVEHWMRDGLMSSETGIWPS